MDAPAPTSPPAVADRRTRRRDIQLPPRTLVPDVAHALFLALVELALAELAKALAGVGQLALVDDRVEHRERTLGLLALVEDLERNPLANSIVDSRAMASGPRLVDASSSSPV